MKYKDIVLTEGIIKVPPALLKQLNLYVSSVYATQIAYAIKTVNQLGSMSITTRVPYDEIEQKKNEFLPKLYKILNYLKSNYNAKILDNMNKIIGNSIKINVPVDEFMNELPKNLQTQEVRNNLENLITRLRISYNNDNRDYSGLSHRRQSGDHIIQITLYNIGDTPEQASNVIKNSMNTVYHEAQHYIQHEVINFVDKSQKQTQRKPGYDFSGDDKTDYYASAVEFSTQIGDLGHLAIQDLENMKERGELTGDVNADITKAVRNTLNSSHKNQIFAALKKYGEIDKHNKGLKIIYSMLFKKYKDVLDNYSTDDTDHGIEADGDIDTNVDVLDTLYNAVVDSHFKALTTFGAMKELKQLSIQLKDNPVYSITMKENDDGSADIILYQRSTEKYKLHFDDFKKFELYAQEIIHSDSTENMLETIEWIEYDLKPEVTYESIENMLKEVQKEYGGKVDGNYIVIPNADDGSDGFVQFKTGNESKDGRISIFLKEIDNLSYSDMKDIAIEIMKSIPKGSDLVYQALENSSSKEEVLDKLKEIGSKKVIDDSDIERVLDKVHDDLTTIYDYQGTPKIDASRLKISLGFPNFVRFQPGIKDKFSVEMVYKGNWHTIPFDELYEVAYYIVITYDQEKEYITKLLSSSDYSDEQFISRIKDAHMGEDNYFEF